MVAINFNEKFVDKIFAGEKIATIRKTKRANAGNKLQLYTGLRTKQCKKFADAMCLLSFPITIEEKEQKIIYNIDEIQKCLIDCYVKDITKSVGFNNDVEAIEFYKKYHKLPFTGYIHIFKLKV